MIHFHSNSIDIRLKYYQMFQLTHFKFNLILNYPWQLVTSYYLIPVDLSLFLEECIQCFPVSSKYKSAYHFGTNFPGMYP